MDCKRSRDMVENWVRISDKVVTIQVEAWLGIRKGTGNAYHLVSKHGKATRQLVGRPFRATPAGMKVVPFTQP